MNQEERFNNILNECLDRILKGETVEQCLLSYPEQARELEPLLKTAKAARIISSVQPRPEFKVEASRRFRAALVEMQVKQNERKAHTLRRWQWRWRSGWAVALIILVIVIAGGGGTIAAASGSMPDSGLYSVKLASEKIQLALTPGETAKTELNAEFADRRTNEIIYLAKKGNAKELQVVASRLNTNLSNISQLAGGNAQYNSQSSGEPAPLLAPQPMGLSQNAAPSQLNTTDLSSPAAPDLAAASASENQITPEAAPGGGALPSPAVEPPSGARFKAVQPDESSAETESVTVAESTAIQSSDVKVHSAKYEKLKKIIQDNYNKRKQKLEEALQYASPEIQSSIMEAIDLSDLEYEQALMNLEAGDDAENPHNPDNAGKNKAQNNK